MFDDEGYPFSSVFIIFRFCIVLFILLFVLSFLFFFLSFDFHLWYLQIAIVQVL